MADLPKRELGRTGMQATMLGYGAMELRGAPRGREVTETQTTVAGDVAVVMNRTQVTGTYRDREINSTGTETVVLRQGDGNWRIVHIHWSSRRQR